MKNILLSMVLTMFTLGIYAQSDVNSAPLSTVTIDPFSFNSYHSPVAQTRMPLYEVFTSSTCGPCYYGNQALKEAQNTSDGNWTCVKYQMYWPGDGDPYFTDEGYSRSRYYDISGVPTLYVDGVNNVGLGSLNQQVMNDFASVPSYVNLDAHYIQNEKNFEIEVIVDPTQDFLTPFIKLFVVIIENKTFNNIESNGETEFDYVMKKMVSGSSGVQVKPLKNGVQQSFEFTYEFQGEYRLPENANDPIDLETEHSVEEFNDLSIVAWLQNRNTGEVLQSTWGTVTSGTNDSKPMENGIISVFPNPSGNLTHLQYLVRKPAYCHLNLMNQSGKQFLTQDLGFRSFGNYTESIDISTLPAGNYILQLVTGDELFTHKVLKLSK